MPESPTRPRRSLEPRASGSLADRAYEELRDRLVTLDIAPGAPLDEDRLIQELEVGRTPIREALKRLALERLVQVYPRRGSFAADINITDLADIADVRMPLEGHAAFRAAERLTPDAEKQLDELVRELRAITPATDNHELLELDTRIHRFIYRATRNAYLEQSLTVYLNLSTRIWHLVIDRMPGGYDPAEHLELLAAVKARDPERARRALVDHVVAFEDAIHAALRKDGSAV